MLIRNIDEVEAGPEEEYYVIDGVRQPSFEKLWGFVFSPDSSRYAYHAEDGEVEFVVLDGENQAEYQDVELHSLAFSPDSRHFAYIARDENYDHVIVLDGVEGEGKDWIHRYMFSPDSQDVFYVSEDWENSPSQFLHIEEMVYGPYQEIGLPIFSRDLAHFAFIVEGEDQKFVVLDGEEQTPYDDVLHGTLIFSPDGEHYAYWAVSAGQWFVVLDGQEGVRANALKAEYLYSILYGSFIRIIQPVFSPDSRMLAYNSLDILDTEAGGLEVSSTFFLNGEGLATFEDVEGRLAPAFSPNGTHLAFFAASEEETVLMIDGREVRTPGAVGGFRFSHDSRYYVQVQVVEDGMMVLINGVPGSVYDRVWLLDEEEDAPDRVRYIALQGDELILVEETLNR